MQTSRREFLTSGVVILSNLIVQGIPQAVGAESHGLEQRSKTHASGFVEIRMRSDQSGANVWFDPIGVYINPGQTIRWIVEANVHTTTAYHPRNDNHSLRIPENATPWNSGYLVNPGQHFDIKLEIEGVYDYYCIPHEMAGMVGRIIVGKPAGPGALTFDYYKGRPGTANWQPVPEAAQKSFPSIERIMKEKIVRH
ncbi:MAG TPA: plastocyanin/azurin family copper-binding protein [Syntrophales bacterium]|nr:plastocyanin/azurin family copper-binding protein [Syntrophales bacterium]